MQYMAVRTICSHDSIKSPDGAVWLHVVPHSLACMRTWLHLAAVDRRCATKRVVRPCPRRCSVSRMLCSVLLSSALVASSNSKILQENCQSHSAGLHPAIHCVDGKRTSILISQ